MPLTLKVASALAASCLMAALAGEARADCSTRHFYNHDDVAFRFEMIGGGSCSIGESPMQGACVVPPGQTAEIHYANVSLINDLDFAARRGNSHPSGEVRIESEDGGREFSKAMYLVKINDGGCYIEHPSDTGVLVMNDPAGGDIQVACRGQCVINIARTVQEEAMEIRRKQQQQQQQQQRQAPQ